MYVLIRIGTNESRFNEYVSKKKKVLEEYIKQ